VRDRTAVSLIAVLVVAAAGGFYVFTADLAPAETPDATFDVDTDFGTDTVVVEHTGGESLASGSVRVLVFERRPVVPDRPVHGTVWEASGPLIQPGARLELEDQRFEPGQTLVVRWYGEDGQGNLAETTV
jgi:hypothetical protein